VAEALSGLAIQQEVDVAEMVASPTYQRAVTLLAERGLLSEGEKTPSLARVISALINSRRRKPFCIIYSISRFGNKCSGDKCGSVYLLDCMEKRTPLN
jgi:hypothetical protein